jgi:uncharacterized protein (DUF362 family)
MGKASIVKTGSGIKPTLIKAIDLIGGLGRFVGRSDRVMLKPNLNGEEGFTNRDLVEALTQLLLDSGVSSVCIGESTFGDAKTTANLFHKTGYAELAARYNIPLHNLNESEAVDVPVARPLITKRLMIAREVFEVDRIINLPNMKVHYATGITLALKNLKGMLVGDEKKRFHEIGLDKAIVDLNNTIRADLQIVDCISCMERMGPRGGDPVKLDLIMAGENAAEVDWVGCKIMCHNPAEIAHLRIFAEMNSIDFGKIEVFGENPSSVKYPFKKAALNNTPPAGFHLHERNACSACMNAFLLSCQFLNSETDIAADISIGALPDSQPNVGKVRIAFGNCVPENDHYDLRIRGCPPYPFALKGALNRSIGS